MGVGVQEVKQLFCFVQKVLLIFCTQLNHSCKLLLNPWFVLILLGEYHQLIFWRKSIRLYKLILPANIGKSGIIQLLYENDSRGTICEGEADTLAEAFKQEHGGFSDVLRQSYGHEPISLFRRTGNEDIEIPRPHLSVVLTSTLDQLTKLIPAVENGLYSRFLYYCLKENPKFIDVFDEDKKHYTELFNKLGGYFSKIYNRLVRLQNPVYFELQSHHKKQFINHFQDQKNELRELVSKSLGGTINRLALMCFRIAMQFSILRLFETFGFENGEILDKIPSKIICTDQDFENSLRLIQNFQMHAISVFWKLPNFKAADSDQGSDKDLKKAEQKRKCRKMKQQKFSYDDIALAVFGKRTMKSTAYRYANES